MDPDPGILGLIPGEHIAQGSLALPPADQHRDAEMAAEVDTGQQWSGLVRIRYLSSRLRAGRSAHWAWVAVHAERI